MDDVKYYIPHISEFYLGFEYEERTTAIVDSPIRGYKVKAYVWEPRKFTANFGQLTWSAMRDDIDTEDSRKNWVRVKYLDRRDIEELGWTYRAANEYGVLYEKPLTNGTALLVHPFGGEHIDIQIEGDVGHVFKFLGTIKNKSELKILMKQLGL